MKKATLIGRLTRDSELDYKQTKFSQDVARLKVPIATLEHGQETPLYLTTTLWGARGERLAKSLRKGTLVAIEARIDNNDYEKDGKKVYGFKFTIVEISILAQSTRNISRAGNSSSHVTTVETSTSNVESVSSAKQSSKQTLEQMMGTATGGHSEGETVNTEDFQSTTLQGADSETSDVDEVDQDFRTDNKLRY